MSFLVNSTILLTTAKRLLPEGKSREQVGEHLDEFLKSVYAGWSSVMQ